MRVPPENTIRYKEYTTVKVPKDSLALAAEVLVNPYKFDGKNYVSEYGAVTKKENTGPDTPT